MPWPLRLLLASAVLTAALVGVGTYLHTPARHTAASPLVPVPSADASTSPSVVPLAEPLSSVDTAMLAVQRAPFCDRLAPADLTAALGGPVRHFSPYSAGQKTGVGGAMDVVDEYGCQWSSARSQAQAWVFAAPVTPQWARQLSTVVPSGCQALHGVTYGAPSAAVRCGGTIRLRGLFGEAWLTCQLSTHDLDLAGRFCLAVARSAE